ncbi:TetR/AcrR family transcriptional regulator [Sphingobium tyrosinilyticum]|uniref:TetR/AcrR family transcriptional regulator n=1 Tax=Sphingobium tyrosinilyticum TaxID=2715436 RepID=A0ABV9F0G9_9SPHN
METVTPRRNQLQEEQRSRTRHIIAQAALKVFSERGYVASSIEQILVKAGVSRAAFYSHFDGKLAVVIAIADDFEPAWKPVFRHLAELCNPQLPELMAWTAGYLNFHRSNVETCTLLTQVAALEEQLYRKISLQRDALIDMLAELQPAFAAAKQDSDVMLEAQILLLGIDQTCFHLVRQHLRNPGDTATRIMASQMRHFFQRNGTR